MILLAGTSNTKLGEAVGKTLNVPLGDVEITRFIDNECRVLVTEHVEGDDVFILQSLSEVADQRLVELCLLGSAVRDLKARRITAVIPWLGYSKQDKAFRVGEAVSSQLVAKFIEAAGFDGVITCELHSEKVLPYFTVPLTELSTHTLLADALRKYTALDAGSVVVVSPDKGGKSRSERFARETGLPVVYLAKSRDLTNGTVTVTGIEGDVSGKTVVIFDDIINTGETAVKTSHFVKAKGATAVLFLATHAVLAGSASETLAGSGIDKIIVTDTISVPDAKSFPALETVTVAGLLADAIRGQIR